MIALPNEEDEIPDEPERRLEITKKILDIAVGEYEIPIEDIVIDPLAMPIGADTSLVNTTLRTIELIHDEFGLNMTLGASNVSFGMPGRHALGATFLPMAMQCGLTSAIMDVRVAADRRGGQGRGPAARQRRLGRRVDRAVPGRRGGREGRGGEDGLTR